MNDPVRAAALMQFLSSCDPDAPIMTYGLDSSGLRVNKELQSVSDRGATVALYFDEEDE